MVKDELLPPAFAHSGALGDTDVVVEVIASTAADPDDTVLALRRTEEAIKASYQALAGDMPTAFSIIGILEELPKRSTSIWMRAHSCSSTEELPASPDDANLFNYLSQGMLIILGWMAGSETPHFIDLERALRVLVWGTGAASKATHTLPKSSELIKAITAWRMAKATLFGVESVTIKLRRGSYPLDLHGRADAGADLFHSKTTNRSSEMIVVVQSPDYQRTGQWQLKFGESQFTADCMPGTLLDGFYERELDIRPGDALHGIMKFETLYGPNHEVLSENVTILEVKEILPS